MLINSLLRSIIFCCLLFTFYPDFLFSQSKSEYYNAPIDTVLTSKSLDKKEEITVILPREYNKNKLTKYPVIIVFDRQNKKEFREIFESINYLVSFDGMPASVIIGIKSENNNNGRYLETSFLSSTKKAKGEQMEGFVFDELIPWAETNFNTSKNRIFIGHSRFGYFSSYLLQDKLNDLTGVISCSPFFTDPNINIVDSLKLKLQKNSLSHMVYYRFITGDSVSDTKGYKLMKSALSGTSFKNFNWKGSEFYAANHFLTPGLSVMPSLLDIFEYWAKEIADINTMDSLSFTANDYEVFINKMKNHYGDKIGIGIAQLNGLGSAYYNHKRYDAAILAWEIMLKDFPMFTNGYINIANAYKKKGMNEEASKNCSEALQQIKNNAFYSDEEKQALIKEIKDLQNAND